MLMTLLARGGVGINGLATILVVRGSTGSYAAAGVVSAALAAGIAISAPVCGRLVDRLGAPRVLVPLAAAHAAAIVTLVVLAEADASTASLDRKSVV